MEKETEIKNQHFLHQDKLKIPKRPAWDSSTTKDQLQLLEKESFLNWRRGLVVLEEELNLLLTPYERNIEVWKQLWRVVERSDLIVQIVDARNPLNFRSEDLENYVLSHNDGKSGEKDFIPKKNLLLINKADMLSPLQR